MMDDYDNDYNYGNYPGRGYNGGNWNEDMDQEGFLNGPGPRPRFGPPSDGFYNNMRGRGGGGRGFRGGGFGRFGPPHGFNNGPFPGPPGPVPHPGRNFSWGRGFGPAGPPISKPKQSKPLKYLMRCGVYKDNLKNLPKAFLKLIEPQYCGLCAVPFDSFEMSRIHYISKNHLKSQKKWLAHHTEAGGGGSRAREIPLKSRFLYCELCDVHITSKIHAASHYAGKPHRAIVEGRKKPKNPMLLQKGMKNRVEQLIRREKKSYQKTTDDHKEEDTVEAGEPIELKPVQPELYCEICKATVTCSEQMTMHLNGKKHLNKEKQHILKMMTGDTADKPDEEIVDVDAEADAKADADDVKVITDDDDDVEEIDDDDDNDVEEIIDDEAEDVEEDGDAEAQGADAEEGDDWANGSGNWDEPQ